MLRFVSFIDESEQLNIESTKIRKIKKKRGRPPAKNTAQFIKPSNLSTVDNNDEVNEAIMVTAVSVDIPRSAVVTFDNNLGGLWTGYFQVRSAAGIYLSQLAFNFELNIYYDRYRKHL